MGHRILIVDDERDLRELLTMILVTDGFETSEATNGQEAFEMLTGATDLPDAILLDTQMPKMDGLTLLGLIKADPRLKHIPVIMVTAYSQVENVKRARSLGAYAYITKPFACDTLAGFVAKAIASSREQISHAG